MNRRRWPVWLAVCAVAVLLIVCNWAGDRMLAGAQFDLTRDRLYTLSPGTRSVLAGLREPVTLRLFYSRQLGSSIPSMGAYADRVREMLRRYARASHGQVRLEFYDPEPFSDVEDRAVAYGLRGEAAERGGAPMYFGLVGTNLLDDERSVSFLEPGRERFLEYDLTRTVLALSDPKRPVVGVMSSLPLDGDQQLALRGLPGGAPWIAMVQLRQAFDVRRVSLDATLIDPKIQVLVVAHAQGLSPATLYAIDQFVMRGGRLLALVDPHSEAEAAQPDPSGAQPMDTSSDLQPLLAAWGVAYDPDQLVGDLQGAWRVPASIGDHVEPVDYVAWFNIGHGGIAPDDPATGDLDQVTVASAGSLSRRAGAAVAFTPLLQSSAQSDLLDTSLVRVDPDPAAILAGFKPHGGPYVIAARVRGMLHSAFAKPPDPSAADAPAYRAATATPANLVVVADSDLLDDRFWVRTQDVGGQPELTTFSDNGAFVINLTGTLAGGDALLGLRGRRGARRPFTRIEAMQEQADLRFRQTEQQLQTHLNEIRGQLDDLRAGRAGTAAAGREIVTVEQQRLIDQLTREVSDTQGRLRQVQGNLRQDIDALESRLRLFDTAAMPGLLVVGAIALAAVRRRRRRARFPS